MKKILAVLFTLLVASALFANGTGESDVIKIAVVGPHSGDLASYGIPTIKATELVVAD